MLLSEDVLVPASNPTSLLFALAFCQTHCFSRIHVLINPSNIPAERCRRLFDLVDKLGIHSDMSIDTVTPHPATGHLYSNALVSDPYHEWTYKTAVSLLENGNINSNSKLYVLGDLLGLIPMPYSLQSLFQKIRIRHAFTRLPLKLYNYSLAKLSTAAKSDVLFNYINIFDSYHRDSPSLLDKIELNDKCFLYVMPAFSTLRTAQASIKRFANDASKTRSGHLYAIIHPNNSHFAEQIATLASTSHNFSVITESLNSEEIVYSIAAHTLYPPTIYFSSTAILPILLLVPNAVFKFFLYIDIPPPDCRSLNSVLKTLHQIQKNLLKNIDTLRLFNAQVKLKNLLIQFHHNNSNH